MLKLLITILLIACASRGQAQNKPRTILWQVHKPGAHHTSYLFGTFHEVNGPYFSSLPASAKNLASSELLFVEQRTGEAKLAESDLVAWNAPKWQALLTSQQRGVFASFVKKAEDSSYYRASPLSLRLILLRIYGQNFCDTLGRTSGELLDQYIEKLALAHQIPVASLDTRADVVKALSPASDSTSEADHVTYCIEIMQAMLQNDYSKCGGFAQEYRDFNLDYEFEQPGKNDLGLWERNAKWLAILDQAFREKNCFVAVGFRHLMYKQGLIQERRRRGYTVTPVSAR